MFKEEERFAEVTEVTKKEVDLTNMEKYEEMARRIGGDAKLSLLQKVLENMGKKTVNI